MTLSFEERLVRLAETEVNVERIRYIEKCFGNDNVLQLSTSNRALVGEGILVKVCRKKPKPRQFFLFNDLIVYGTIVLNKKKYINPNLIELKNVQIKSIPDGDDPELRNGWIIMSPKKTFCVYASTVREKIEWMTHISNCIEKLSNNNRKAFDQVKNVDVAPQWIPDRSAETCMRCRKAKFTMVNRRHHCRQCGFVICGDCSKNRYKLPSQSEEPLRVCNECYNKLTNNNASPNKDDLANTDSSEDSDSDEKITAPPAPKPNDEAMFY